MSDWIENTAGVQPVSDDTIVEFELADGCKAQESAGDLEWGLTLGDATIIRYRVVSTNEANPTATILREIADEVERVGVERAHEAFEVWDDVFQTWFPVPDANELFNSAAGSPVRRKPRTIQIGDYTVPAPLRVAPEKDASYYAVDFSSPDGDSVVEESWDDMRTDRRMLNAGMIHADRESARQHARALIAVSGGQVEE